MDYTPIPVMNIVWMALGAVIYIAVPVTIAILWKIKKKEAMTSILAGALTWLLFALIIEKPIQNVLIFPTAMGLPEHGASVFINARPILWSFLVGLFPGVFEETGRLVVYKTLLRKRKNRETSISHGIGHGGFEALFMMGYTSIAYIAYSVMINTGAYTKMVEQSIAKTPAMADTINAQAAQITELLSTYTFGSLAIGIVERVFAVLFHIGASVLVFYACKEKKKFWLYPLAIALHTALDGIAALNMAGVVSIPAWGLEVIVAVFGLGVFFGAYFLLYKKDPDRRNTDYRPYGECI